MWSSEGVLKEYMRDYHGDQPAPSKPTAPLQPVQQAFSRWLQTDKKQEPAKIATGKENSTEFDWDAFKKSKPAKSETSTFVFKPVIQSKPPVYKHQVTLDDFECADTNESSEELARPKTAPAVRKSQTELVREI